MGRFNPSKSEAGPNLAIVQIPFFWQLNRIHCQIRLGFLVEWNFPHFSRSFITWFNFLLAFQFMIPIWKIRTEAWHRPSWYATFQMPFFTLQYDRGLNFKADMRYSEFSVSCSFLKVREMSILTHWRIDDRWGQVGTGGHTFPPEKWMGQWIEKSSSRSQWRKQIRDNIYTWVISRQELKCQSADCAFNWITGQIPQRRR